MEASVLRDWTREDLYRAAEAGVFRPEERLELIDGQLVTKMSPQGKPHVICVLLIDDWLDDQTGDEFHVRTQMPLALGVRDEPEPDVMVVRGKPSDYLEEHPSPEDVVLVVEVGDSTLTRDRRLKVPRYALAGIVEVWLVDVENRRLEIYREPVGDGYGVVTIFAEGKEVSPLFRPEARVVVSELLPNPKSQ